MRSFITLLLITISLVSFGQDTYKVKLVKDNQKEYHVPFISVYSGKSVGDPMRATTIEAGTWGIESKSTYSAFASFSKYDTWVGVKAYYTILDAGRVSSMLYAAPQMKVTHGNLFIVEEGIGLNLGLTKKLLVGYYVGFTHNVDDMFTPVTSFGATYLFRKKK